MCDNFNYHSVTVETLCKYPRKFPTFNLTHRRPMPNNVIVIQEPLKGKKWPFSNKPTTDLFFANFYILSVPFSVVKLCKK